MNQINLELFKSPAPTTTINQNYQSQQANPVGSLHPPSSAKVQLKATRRHGNHTNLSNGVETTS